MKILLTALGAGVTGAVICKVLVFEVWQIGVVAMLCFSLVGMSLTAALCQRAPASSPVLGSVVLLRADEKLSITGPKFDTESWRLHDQMDEGEVSGDSTDGISAALAAWDRRFWDRLDPVVSQGDLRIANELLRLGRMLTVRDQSCGQQNDMARDDEGGLRDLLSSEVTPGEARLVVALLDEGMKLAPALALNILLRRLKEQTAAGQNGAEVQVVDETICMGDVGDQGKNGVELPVTKEGENGVERRVTKEGENGVERRATKEGENGVELRVTKEGENGVELRVTKDGRTGELQDVCPTCGPGTSLIPIIFGGPAPEDAERVARGEIEMRGCVLPDGTVPAFRCKACNRAF